MSRRTFDRRFKELTGVSPLQWLLHQRIQSAQRLLEETDLTVDDIAHQVGLRTALTLRRNFHHVADESPSSTGRGSGCPCPDRKRLASPGSEPDRRPEVRRRSGTTCCGSGLFGGVRRHLTVCSLQDRELQRWDVALVGVAVPTRLPRGNLGLADVAQHARAAGVEATSRRW